MSKVEGHHHPTTMSKVERFEDLRVWAEARALANALYDATGELRDFAFRDQLRRAAVSVMNNIAEGLERRTDADFAHFLDMAKGSSGEARSMTYLGEDRRYFATDTAIRLRAAAESLSGGLSTFATYLRRPRP
ncbi:MAG: four helix bundle protein [Verrucomicrobiota bacterium]